MMTGPLPKSSSLSFYFSLSSFFSLPFSHFSPLPYYLSFLFSFIFLLIFSRLMFVPLSLPFSIFYWHESQMNSINKASKYKRILTREIINKPIKHKPSDFPSVSFFCLHISIVFCFLSFFSLSFFIFFLY